MTTKKIIEDILRDFDKRVEESEARIMEAVDRYTDYNRGSVFQDGYLYTTEHGEEDGPLEQAGWFVTSKTGKRDPDLRDFLTLLKLKEPLLEVLRQWTDNRKVYPEEWVKILLEATYNQGRSRMRDELRKTGEKP